MSKAHFRIYKAALLKGMRHKIICAISLSPTARVFLYFRMSKINLLTILYKPFIVFSHNHREYMS